MAEVSEYLEDMIEKCGGFGKYQVVLTVILFASKVSMTWTMLMMAFAGAKPDWWCVNESIYGNETRYYQRCYPMNSSECFSYSFSDSMRTIVNEWSLICDKAWVPTTTITIQMGGVLVGGLLCGQMGDYFGRKPTLFFAIVLITATNTVAFFSVSWQMFAVLRFFMGISCGMNLTVTLVLHYEFISVRNRAVVSGIPSWAVFAAIFAFVAWLVPDWKHLHIITAATACPLLLTWWIVPESFRWLVTHHRFDEARDVIKKMARFNGAPEPGVSNLEILKDVENSAVTYTFLDILKGKYLLKNTICLAFMWITCGYVFYAISFSVQSLSGSLYLNMFLLSAVAIPPNALTICCNNRIGRKWTTLGFFLLCAFASLGVALVQVLNDGSAMGALINAFAIVSMLSCGAGWVCLIVLSTEIYPTVVRNLGYGFHNTAARIGGMIAPQMIFLSDTYPGLLYFLCFGLMLTSAVCAYLCSETRGQKLQDIIKKKTTEFDLPHIPEKNDYQMRQKCESIKI